MVVRLICGVAIVHTGAADHLRYNNTLCTVDDKGAALGHQREIAHENFLLLDLAGFLVQETHTNLDGLCIGGIALTALVNRILGGIVHGKVQEAQLQITGIIGNGAHIAEYLLKALVEKILIGLLLDAQHIGHVQDVIVLLIRLSEGFAVVYVFHHCHRNITRPFLPGSRENHRAYLNTPGSVVTF